MNIKPIRNDDDLRAAFKRLEPVFQAKEGSPEADEMEILVTLIEAYELQALPRALPIRLRRLNSEWTRTG